MKESLQDTLTIVASGMLSLVAGAIGCALMFPVLIDQKLPEQSPRVLVLDMATLAMELDGLNGVSHDKRAVIAGETGKRLNAALKRLSEEGVVVIDSSVVVQLPKGRTIGRAMVMEWSEKGANIE